MIPFAPQALKPLKGAVKYQRIYALVRQVPRGRATTYGNIARLVPGCTPRMVGYAMAALPEDTDVPWHRVINAQGRISIRRDGGDGLVQRLLLEDEGIVFDRDGRTDLECYGWMVPDLDFL